MTWRVGLVIPSSNAVMEVDFYRSLPHDATLHTARFVEEFQASDDPVPAVEAVRAVGPHIVVLGLPVTGLRGEADERTLAARVGATGYAAPLTTHASLIRSLRDTRASRIVIVTPYQDDVNRRMRARIESEGFHVSSVHGMGRPVDHSSSITPEEIYAFVQASVGPRVQGDSLLLASTDFQALGALSLLKMTYDLPIVTSNLAALQAVKRELDRLRDGEMTRARGFAAAP